MSRSATLLLSLALAGCTADILGGGPAGGPGAAGGVLGPNAGASPGAQGSGVCAEAAPAPMYLRRLTNQEYAQSVRALVGIEPKVAALPSDLSLYGFDNNAESISISTAHVDGFRAAAESAVAELVASEALRQPLVGCDPSGGACLESFTRRFGLRAFRRPLLEAEVSALLALAATATPTEGAWGSVGRVVEAVLQSASFLFRVEQGAAEPKRPERARLTGYELATRLSYLLWGTTPDEQLLQAAQNGSLDSAEGVAAQALGMLSDDTRARPAVWSFARQWLRVASLEHVQRPATEFPAFSDALRAAMLEETRRVVEDYTSRPGVPLLGLLDSPKTFVDATLASFYGVAAPPAGQWAQVTLPAAQGRAGILTQASILTLTATTGATTPILRGKFVRQVLLCDDLPPPPPQVPALPDGPEQAGLGERERLAVHRSNPACSGCHALLEPLGFGLAHFDAIGAYRESDASGRPIDATGVIDGLDDAAFNGSAELVARLRREPRVGACLSTHLLRFALGRKETDAEKCAIGELTNVLTQGGDFATLVQKLVTSDTFRYRQSLAAEQGAQP